MPELNQPTNNLDELYQAAEVAKPEFFQLVEKTAQITGGQAVIAPLKSRERAEAKIAAEYAGNAAEIKDLLRASIHYKSLKQLYQGLEQLKAEGAEVLLLKDRFLHPRRSGYRDVLVNIRTPNGVIAELQLHLEQILVAKQEGHKYYEQEQELSRRSKLENRKLTPEESYQIEAIRAKQKELYEAAFLQAQVEERTQTQGLIQSPSTKDREFQSSGRQQQSPELNSALVQREALVTAVAVWQMLKLVGQTQPDGSTTFDSVSFHFAQQGDIVTVTTQDNREVLRVQGDIAVFNPTVEDREKLQELRQKVENVLNKQQQQQQQQQQ